MSVDACECREVCTSSHVGIARMRLDLVAFRGCGQVGFASFDRACDGGQRAGGEGAELACEPEHPRGKALQHVKRMGQLVWPFRRCVAGSVRGAHKQRGQGASQDLGVEVDPQRALVEPGGGFQPQAKCLALERFFDMPALAVLPTEAVCLSKRGGDLWHQPLDLSVRSDLTDRADRLRPGRIQPDGGLPQTQCIEGHMRFVRVLADDNIIDKRLLRGATHARQRRDQR